jgi:GT2 family glycosyltransferase
MSTFSVVICAYTIDRWTELLAAVRSVQDQTLPPAQVVLVIDHNPSLYELSRKHFNHLVVVENSQERGLSGARNTGIAFAQGDLIAFIDDDAIASPDWLENLASAFHDSTVLGVGGTIEPRWQTGRPDWFPQEFDWVVGCSYLGLPEISSPVRNLIGCNMAFRPQVFETVGGFRTGIGRLEAVPLGCEETELCIRAKKYWPQGRFIYQPRARVSHKVSSQRSGLKYFRSRCYAEGLSKALVASLVGAGDGLDTERSYVLHTLPRGVLHGLRNTFLRQQPAEYKRSAAIIIGLAWTISGYVSGKASLFLKRDMKSMRSKTIALKEPA